MKKRILHFSAIILSGFFLFLSNSFLLFGQSIANIPAEEKHGTEFISLSGSDWQIKGVEPESAVPAVISVDNPTGKGWLPAKVPGNVQADLEAALKLKPLYYGMERCTRR